MQMKNLRPVQSGDVPRVSRRGCLILGPGLPPRRILPACCPQMRLCIAMNWLASRFQHLFRQVLAEKLMTA